MTNPQALLPPGFRFHPTDEELVLHYLRNRAASQPCPVSIIAEVDIYKFNPWDLPDKAVFGNKEWYFFTPRDRKYPNGVRPNRATPSGYWKATGTDKPITTTLETGRMTNIGVKKALVFYVGKPPKGTKTNWFMHEYRLTGLQSSSSSSSSSSRILYQYPMKQRDLSMRLDDWVLCRIFKKHIQSQTTPPMASHLDLVSSDLDSQDSNCAMDRLHKSTSWSNILQNADNYAFSLLIHEDSTTAPEIAGGGSMDYVSLSDHRSSSQNYFSSSGSCTPEPSLGLDMGSGVKRQRTTDEGGYALHPSKSYINGSLEEASSRCNLLAQAFLRHQQMTSNSRLGFQ